MTELKFVGPVNMTGHYSKIISRPRAGLFRLIYKLWKSLNTKRKVISITREYLLQITLNKIIRGPQSEQSASNLFQQPDTRKTSSNSIALLNLSLLCFINPEKPKSSKLQNRNASFTISFLLWILYDVFITCMTTGKLACLNGRYLSAFVITPIKLLFSTNYNQSRHITINHKSD